MYTLNLFFSIPDVVLLYVCIYVLLDSGQYIHVCFLDKLLLIVIHFHSHLRYKVD